MKGSGSDWDLDEFLVRDADADAAALWGGGGGGASSPENCRGGDPPPPAAFAPFFDGGGGGGDVVSGRQVSGAAAAIAWQHGLATNHSISPTIDTQSSLCGSPTEIELTDDEESLEIEVGSGEQGNKVNDNRRLRRMVSNRESARRSRKRKQAHLNDLESQVDQLRKEGTSLYKQLGDANQQFREAVTDNRVLKSDVENLRMKVRMAEDLCKRGPMACGLDHLFQSHIGTSSHALDTRLPHFGAASGGAPLPPPSVDVQGSAVATGMLATTGHVQSVVGSENCRSGSTGAGLQSSTTTPGLDDQLHGQLPGEGINGEGGGDGDPWWDSQALSTLDQL